MIYHSIRRKENKHRKQSEQKKASYNDRINFNKLNYVEKFFTVFFSVLLPCFHFVFFANTLLRSLNSSLFLSPRFHVNLHRSQMPPQTHRSCSCKAYRKQLVWFFFLYNFRTNGKLLKTVYLSNAIFNWQLKADEEIFKKQGTGQQPHFDRELYCHTQPGAQCLIQKGRHCSAIC